MRKIIFSLIILFAVLGSANAYVDVQQPTDVTLSAGRQTVEITVNTNESVLDFSVIAPDTVHIFDVDIVGTENYDYSSNSVVYLKKESTAHLWSFKDLDTDTFKITVHFSSETPEQINSVWVYPPSNFDSRTTQISITEPILETNGWISTLFMIAIMIISAYIVYHLVNVYKKQNGQKNKKETFKRTK